MSHDFERLNIRIENYYAPVWEFKFLPSFVPGIFHTDATLAQVTISRESIIHPRGYFQQMRGPRLTPRRVSSTKVSEIPGILAPSLVVVINEGGSDGGGRYYFAGGCRC